MLQMLGRLTSANNDRVKHQFLSNPICKLSDSELVEIVQTMSKIAVTQPEAQIEAHAKLMVDWVRHCGTQGKGRTIRTALIDFLQDQFQPTYQSQHPNGTARNDAELARKTTLRGNSKLLGRLFVAGMINEKIVHFVLDELLYGRAPEKRATHLPEEWELEAFCDLLSTVAKNLSAKAHSELIPVFLNSLDFRAAKARTHVRTLIMNLKELYRNNWEVRRPACAARPKTAESAAQNDCALELQPITSPWFQPPAAPSTANADWG